MKTLQIDERNEDERRGCCQRRQRAAFAERAAILREARSAGFRAAKFETCARQHIFTLCAPLERALVRGSGRAYMVCSASEDGWRPCH